MNKSIFAFFSVVLITAAIAAVSLGARTCETFASCKAAEGKTVLIIADYLDIEDISKMDFLGRLAVESHVALISNRQPGKAGASRAKLIIGSGKRLELDAHMTLGGSADNGRESLTGSLQFTDINKVISRNADSEYQNCIGYIGEIINKHKGNSCFIGNADTDNPNRISMLIAIDSGGGVDSGETENIHIADESFPYGIRTDYHRLAELYKQYLPASSFMVIETGDMERLEAFRSSMSREAYEAHKQDVLKNIDSLMKDIFNSDGYETLIFISTYPSISDADGSNKLTPVLVYEEGVGGVLYSSNTRREGIILNIDLADYILYKLGYANNNAILELKKEEPLNFLRTMNRNIIRTSTIRAPVLTYYAVMMIVALVLLFTIAVFFSNGQKIVWPWLSSYFAYTMISFPIALFYVPTSYLGDSPVKYIAVSMAASGFLSLVLQITLKDRIKIILSVCLVLLIGLSIDILIGSPFIKQSVLGYNPVIGARFYGIGNEYAGMFMGCSLMVFGCIQELRGKRFTRAAAGVYFSACTCLLGLTFLGANFGGALAGAFGYLLAYYMVFDIKFNSRNVFKGISILSLAVAALIIADSLGISSQSHLGKLVADTKANGFGVIISTIQRKISMNIRLLRYTIWTKVLLCAIAIISIMFYKPVKQMFDIFNKYKYMRYSWISLSASAVAGFAVNDSGIVVAATSLIYAAFTMLIMCIGERNES